LFDKGFGCKNYAYMNEYNHIYIQNIYKYNEAYEGI
jgi:hypothetical protein